MSYICSCEIILSTAAKNTDIFTYTLNTNVKVSKCKNKQTNNN